MADKKKRQPNFTETELLSLITAVAEKKSYCLPSLMVI